jgi:probable HAF family extracellular repeat protein
MNDRGQAVGVGWLAPDAQGFHPFLWEKGRVTDLGVLERGEREYGRATDINEHGLVVGFGVVDQDPEQSGMHAFRWQDGVLTDLGVPGEDSLARAVNNRGQAVGTRYPAGTGAHAVVWHDATATDLGPGQAFDINDRGQIIGWTPERGATMWYRGRAHDLGAPPGLDDWTPVAINERGWIVGTARVGLFERSYLRRISSFVDLGTLGGSSTSVVGLDDLGDVFGTSETAGPVTGPHPFRWRHGRMTDLSTRGVSAESPVMGVGPRGEILGAVGPPDNVHAGLYR